MNRCLPLLAPWLLASCTSFDWDWYGTDRDDIEGDDKSAFTQNLLVEFPLDERRREADPKASYAAVEVGVSHVSGDFDQSRDSGDVYELDKVDFLGAGEDLDGDFDLYSASLVIHQRYPVERFTLGILAGLGVSDLDIEIESEGVKDDDDFFGVGVVAGVSATFEVVPTLELFSRGEILVAVEDYDSSVSHSTGDFGVSWSLFGHLTVAGGWRFGRYKLDRNDDYESDVKLHYEGPLLQVRYTY